MKFRKELDPVTQKSYIHIDLEGLKVPNLSDDMLGLLDFSVDTYVSLKTNKGMEFWNDVFGIPEAFLATLSEEHLQQIASMYVICHYEILQHMDRIKEIPENDRDTAVLVKTSNALVFKELENRLSELVASLDNRIDLFPKLLSYTTFNVPIQQFEHAGERPQDSSEMTFYRNDVIVLTALALLSKLLTPITGIFIKKFMKLGIDNQYKEIHAVTIFRDIIANRCQPLADKLSNFIANVIKPNIKNPKPTNVFNGFTAEVTNQYIYATMLTRKFVTVNLFRDKTNLVTFLTTCAKETASSQSTGGPNKPSIELRREISELSSSFSEDGNVSVLEQESSTSSKPADFPVIIEAVVNNLKNNFCVEHELDDTIVSAAEAYYLSSGYLTLTSANSYLLSIMFGNRLCGARTVEMLKSTDLARLIAMMQLYFVVHGMTDLVPLVSLINSGAVKVTKSQADLQLAANWCNSFAYVNCEERFQCNLNGITWSSGLKNIVEDVTGFEFRHNTAPAILEVMGSTVQNGTLYDPPATLSESICNFILHQIN